MRIFFGIIGATIKWIFSGFNKSFVDILYGDDKGKNRIVEETNLWLGLAVILILALILTRL